MLLSLPGVLISAVMIGICLKIFLDYDELSWYGALAIGSILSATDSFSVVNILKNMGASAHFSTLVEGESLFNNAIATAFY